jgi:SulP family sulfate permease
MGKIVREPGSGPQTSKSLGSERWLGDLRGGSVAAVTTLAVVLTWGVLAYSPLGPDYVAAGIRAAFVSATVAAIVAALAGGMTIAVNGPRASVVLIFTAYVAGLAADPRLVGAGGPDAEAIVLLASACLALAGAVQLAFGAFRLGGLVRFLPHPVLAGFILGVAILIVVAQVPHLLGIAGRVPERSLPAALAAAQPATLAIGVGTAALAIVIARRKPGLPAVLVAVVVFTAVHHVLHGLAPALALGPVLGKVTMSLAPPGSLLEATSGRGLELLATHWPELVNTALVLAAVASLDTLLGAAAVDVVAGTRHGPARALVGQGLGNLTSAALGGIPLAYSTASATAAYRAGARTRAAGVYCALGLAALLIFAQGLVALVPVAVLSGVMLTLALGLVDRWAGSLARRTLREPASWDTLLALAVVAAVCVVTIASNEVVAVALGVVLSMVLFIAAMNRSLIRTVATGGERQSRRVYREEVAARLRTLGRRIKVLDLEGPLFFGTADRLSRETQSAARGARVVILDMRRVESIDATGAITLEQISRRLAQDGVALYLAHVTPQGRRGHTLSEYRTFLERPRRDWFEDVDRALEAAEHLLLTEDGMPTAAGALPLEQSVLCAGLAASEVETLSRHLERHELAAGDVLFREGDAGDRFFVLLSGVITIATKAPHGTHRLVTAEPGAMFGELAMIDGAPRSATARAEEEAVLVSLSAGGLARLESDEPRLAARLLQNVMRHVANRLRISTDVARMAADAGD